MTIEDRLVETPRIDIGTLTWGDPAGRPTLTLHGWLDNAASYVPMAPFLTDRQMVALDMPGHGASGHRPDGYHYYVVDYVADIIAVADALGFEEFDLIGHSLGGAVSLLLTALFPERVRRLALIEALGPLTRDPESAPESMSKALEQMRVFTERSVRRKPAVYSDPEVAVKAREKIGDISESSARLLVMRNMREVEAGWVWRSDPRLKMRSPMYLTEEQVLAYVKRVQCETLLIRGNESGFAGRDKVVERTGALSTLKTVDLPGKHHLHMETPEAVAEQITDFLDA